MSLHEELQGLTRVVERDEKLRPVKLLEKKTLTLASEHQMDVRVPRVKSERNHQAKRRNIPMKIQITVDIKNDDGTLGAESTVLEVDVPDFEAFTGPDKFGVVFDEYERKVLKARNEAIATATEKYLSEMAKKKHIQRYQK